MKACPSSPTPGDKKLKSSLEVEIGYHLKARQSASAEQNLQWPFPNSFGQLKNVFTQ